MTTHTFVKKEHDKAYIANSLWLPKTGIRTEPVQKALEFTVQTQQGQVMLRMWDESRSHIICPREFLPHSEYAKFKFPFVDLRPDFEEVDFEDNVTPRDEEQQRAWDALALNDNGILNLACGKGKTILAVKKIAQRRVPTLVVVPDTGIMSQWEQAISRHLKFDGKVGIIKGKKFEWNNPVVIALVTTLWKRIEEDDCPAEMFRYFGQVEYDEVHQIGAPKFALTAAPFYGDRLGFTATVEREDGLDPIYRYHIGDPFYSDLTQQLIPEIFFQQTPAVFDHLSAMRNGATNMSVLRTMMGRDRVGNIFRYWHIKQALDAGRKIICISHSKDQLRLLHALFPGSGLLVQETKNRMEVLRNSRVCFAIAKLGSTGIDDDRLDTLFWLTPFSSKIALQQSMGRIQRILAGKKDPLYVVFEDWLNAPLKRIVQSLKHDLKKWGFKYNVVKPNNMPREFPPDIERLYDAAFKELPTQGETVDE